MRQPKIVTTLKTYDRSEFAADVIAGVTVAMVALPLSLAIAIASGAEPATGLVTAIIAGFLISALGGSRVQIGGPTGAFIVVVAGVIAVHGYDGLVLATLMAGVILLVAGWFRAGNLIAYVPEAVVNGFTIGIGVIIATSQVKDFLGLSVDHVPAEFLEKLPALWTARDSLNPGALAIALLTMVLILALRRLFPRFPGSDRGCGRRLGLRGGVRIERRYAGLPVRRLAKHAAGTGFPEVSWGRVVELFPSSLIIAFLAGVELLLSAMVADRMISGSHRPNAELTAQGVANIGSALFGGLPATGAIARTATNIRAGGKTPVAGIVHAVTVLVVMMVAAPLAGQLALPALAALLIITAWNMSEPHKWGEYARGRTSDKVLLLLTMALTVLVDLTVAIGVGVAVGLALRLRRQAAAESDWQPPKR